jgi:hypothetical protein
VVRDGRVAASGMCVASVIGTVHVALYGTRCSAVARRRSWTSFSAASAGSPSRLCRCLA